MNFTKMILGILGLVALQISGAGAAQAADEPLLRIEAGMHIAPIVAMATDAANKFVATGSEDKTVRLWSLPGGRPAAILRIPVGHGTVGKIYSVAISPDGALVAVGGWTTSEKEEQVYLLESRTGALVRRLTGLSNVTASLAFSRDGQFLVAGLGGHQGIVVYDAKNTWRLVATDTAYGGVVKSLAFDSTGRLATSCSDGVVRIYAAGKFDRPRATKQLDGRPDQIAYSPDGAQLAVAFADQPRIAVLSATNLSPLFKPDVSGLEGLPGGFHAVTWSASGDVLMAGGSVRMGETGWLRRWSGGGRGFFTDLPAANDTVRRLVPLRDGSILFATMDPAFGVVTPAAAVHVLQASGKLDFRPRAGGILTANERGDAIDADVVFPAHRLAVSMRDRSVDLNEPASTGTSPPRVAVPGLSVTGWRDGLTPALNGAPLPLERSETARSLAVEPEGKAFVLGTSWRLLRFDSAGQPLWSKATEGAVWNAAIAANGRAVVAAQGDGTIRWRRLSDGAEVLALFVTPDARRWVAWTPSGYYDASPGGESLIGWQVGQGPDAAPTFHPAWQFRERFYRPDVVARIIDTLDETAALGVALAVGKAKDAPTISTPAEQAAEETIATSVPPTISIGTFPDTTTAGSPDIKLLPRFALGVSVDPPPPAGGPRIEATIDGRSVDPTYVRPLLGGLWEVGLVIPDGIPAKTLDVTLYASNVHGRSAPATTQVKWQGSSDAQEQKPLLYVVAVGVSKYPNLPADANLEFPAKDAEAFASAMSTQKGRAFSDVKTTVLTDDQATLANIKRELRQLRKKMRPLDVAMVFLSGHGAEPTRDWAFDPSDVNPRDEDSQLSGEDLNRWITDLPGIKVLFLDSCFSGAALRDRGLEAFRSVHDKNQVINALTTAPTGVVVFSSSTGGQKSWEDPASRHGAYTAALLEGLAGKAGGPEVGMFALADYLDRRVRELTNKQQTPTMTPSYGMPSMTIAIVTDATP